MVVKIETGADLTNHGCTSNVHPKMGCVYSWDSPNQVFTFTAVQDVAAGAIEVYTFFKNAASLPASKSLKIDNGPATAFAAGTTYMFRGAASTSTNYWTEVTNPGTPVYLKVYPFLVDHSVYQLTTNPVYAPIRVRFMLNSNAAKGKEVILNLPTSNVWGIGGATLVRGFLKWTASNKLYKVQADVVYI